MALQMLYVLPMLLGRTYDARTGNIGVDIFPLDDVQNAVNVSFTAYRSKYEIVETTSDVQNMLKVYGDLSLKIKAGVFGIDGYGSFIKESVTASNSVNILTTVNFRTYTKTLKNSIKPVDDWLQRRPEDLGTHFVQSISYGGDLIASIRFRATDKKYLQDIKAMVKASLSSGTALDLVAEGKLEMLENKLEKKANMEVSYYATVPVQAVPYNISGLRNLIKDFDVHVKKVNNGWGRPVEVTLQELSSYGSKIAFLKNKVLESELQLFEEKFDDLLSTKSELRSFVKSMSSRLTSKEENQLENLRSRISETLRAFYDVIGRLDLEKGSDQLQSAYEVYEKNKKSGSANTYKRELTRLVKRMETAVEKPKERGSSVYVHYGRQSCRTDDGDSTLYSGYVTSSPEGSQGSGTNYLCLPDEPQEENTTDVIKEASKASVIKGIKFGILEIPPFQIDGPLSFERTVCSICFVRRSTVTTFYGQKGCPLEWREEYSGFAMAPSVTTRGEHVCMDQTPTNQPDSDTGVDDQKLVMVVLQERQNSDDQRFVPCVVCSK